MDIFQYVIAGAWAVFIIVWLVSSWSTKRTLRHAWWRGSLIRVVALVAVLYLLRESGARVSSLNAFASNSNPWLAGTGAALAVLGIAFAVWARLHIGRNWGMPMSVKENPELVTTGPYALVRHPIYTGVMLALLGSGITSLWWLGVFIVSLAYFVYSATREEKLMAETFPDTYPSYKARTKMLIPFVL